MTGRIVSATQQDTIRIEVLGEGRAINIPAKCILAMDRVLRYCLTGDSSLDLDMVEIDETGWQGWEGTVEHPDPDTDVDTVLHVHGDTPWQTIVALADAIEKDYR